METEAEMRWKRVETKADSGNEVETSGLRDGNNKGAVLWDSVSA